jgi:hypothetical protein
MDGTHLTGLFDGVLFTFNIKDANGDNVTVLAGQLGQENKENWLLIGSVILKAFDDLQLLIV